MFCDLILWLIVNGKVTGRLRFNYLTRIVSTSTGILHTTKEKEFSLVVRVT